MGAITKRVIKQIVNDKRTIVLIIVAPMLILTLMSLLLGTTNYTPKIVVDKSAIAPPIYRAIEKQDVTIVDKKVAKDFDAKAYFENHKDVDAILYISPSETKITMYEADSKSQQAMKEIQKAFASLNPKAEIKTDFIIGNSDETFFDSLGYVFLGIISFFLIFIVSGMALVRERNAGTLERMLMTPVKRGGVVAGYTLGYGLFAILQGIILVVFSIYVLGMSCAGDVAWVVLIMLLLSICAVSFGELISVFANTEFQVVQLIPIAIIPQIFFSGLIPLDLIPYHLGNLGYIMPVFYGCTAIKNVMRLGLGFSAIWPYILALLGYIVVLSILNMLALKKYRKL